MKTSGVSILLALALLLGGDSASGDEPEARAIKLPERETRLGVQRAQVVELAEGENDAFPALAVTPKGEVLVAYIGKYKDRERVWLRKARSPVAPLTKPAQVSIGYQAWHPRLAAGPGGKVWLTWCGADLKPERGSHDRSIFLRRVHPGPAGPVLRVSRAYGRNCNPEIAVGEHGSVHLVWELSLPGSMHESRIAYRELTPRGRFRAVTKVVSPGPFDRRPAVTLAGKTLHVAWDSLVDKKPTGRADPDYDIFLREKSTSGWSEVLSVDTRMYIQAAPALAVDREGCLLVAYHSSHRHPLVKWWDIRRVCNRQVQGMSVWDPVSELEPSGEQQGAEFPEIGALPDGRIVVFSRPSQGAYLQLIDKSGVSRPLDLTRKGWGARGMRAQLAVAPDGSVLVARRARHSSVLERFELPDGKPHPMPFGKLTNLGPKDASTGVNPASKDVLFGDLHMHSAASDGTGPPDEIYARAWVRGLDFAALTDHDYIIGSPLLPSSFDEIAWVTDAFNARDGFTALHAYEWTTPQAPKGSGHRNVYFRGHAPVNICGSKSGCPDSASLYGALRRGEAIAIPHHTSWMGTVWENVDQKIQRQFEIVSVHGACEYQGNQPISSRGSMQGMFALDGLARGLRFGFVGGTDAHGLLWHHGIARARDPWSLGLTGVPIEGKGPENVRAVIFDALRNRRTFATSGVKRPVSIGVGSLPMGSEGTVRAPVVVHYQSAGYDRITLVRDGEVIHTTGDSAGKYTDATVDPGAHYYYLRATAGIYGSFVGMAWTSPVFVTVTTEGE